MQNKSSSPYEQKTVPILSARKLYIQLFINKHGGDVGMILTSLTRSFFPPKYFGDGSAYQDHVILVEAHFILLISESFHQTSHSPLPQHSAYSFL